MRFEQRVFQLPKDSEYPDLYQDAWELDAESGRATIADGVSSAIFSGPWARIVTRAVIARPPDFESETDFPEWLAGLRQAWRDGIDFSKLAWHQRPKMVDGAMTTLLWLELTPSIPDEIPAETYRLRSFAIGDCALFHLRDGELLRMFPVESSADFGLDPSVIGSIDRKLDHLLEFKYIDDECKAGDTIVLCTDPIGLWALNRWEANDPVDWSVYWDMSPAEWEEEIFRLRRASLMRFDDTTLALLRVVTERPAPVEPPQVREDSDSPPDGSPAEAGESLFATPSDDASWCAVELEGAAPLDDCALDQEQEAPPYPDHVEMSFEGVVELAANDDSARSREIEVGSAELDPAAIPSWNPEASSTRVES